MSGEREAGRVDEDRHERVQGTHQRGDAYCHEADGFSIKDFELPLPRFCVERLKP